jgi:DNA-directed RNA polymerase subunit RPC12/RpoP
VYDFPPAGESASGERVMENPRRLQLTADLPMLYDVLAFQLALAITCSEGLLVCAACNQPFVRASKPVPGRQVFCRSCGHRAAVRLWTRKRRALEKKEEKKR